MSTSEKVRVLVIEDDPDGGRSVKEALEDGGCEVYLTVTAEQGCALLASQTFDAVLSDLVLPGIDGLGVLDRAHRIDPALPVLIMTAHSSVETAVRALKSGAYDYILKPLDLEELQSKVSRAVETRRLRSEVRDLQRTITNRFQARHIVAASTKMQEVLRKVGAVADTTATVLVLGESGTGKELAARALHAESRRATGPFVAINCGAFAETMLESELFGHEKGAFTGAAGRRLGAFERAHGGTLFLDEVGVAPKSVQVHLLRAIEEKEIIRVGGEAPVKVDVRIVAASNRDLEDLVEHGEFLQDLLYRLQVIKIEIPPLRERVADIRPLADRFVAMACEEHGRRIDSIDPDYFEALEGYNWPGNVRELRNIVESSVIMVGGPRLHATDLNLPRRGADAAEDQGVPEGVSLAQIERQALLQSLTRNKGNRQLTAQALGLSVRTIQRKIKEHNLPF